MHITGLVPLFIIAGIAALLWLGYFLRFPWRKNILCAGLFLTLSVCFYIVFDVNVVRVLCVKQDIIVTQGLKTMVILRGTGENAEKILTEIEQYNRNKVDFLIDLRRSGDTEKAAAILCAEKTISAKSDFFARTTIQPFRDIMVVIRKQEKGNFACFDIGGYTFCAVSGTVDLQMVQGIDAFIGGGKIQNAPNVRVLEAPYTGAALRCRKSIQFMR